MNSRDYKEFAPDCFYHLYNRGNGKMKIFRSDEDYLNFLKRLRYVLGKEKVTPSRRPRSAPLPENAFTLLCYCLMPNHFHLFIRQNSSVSLSKLLLKVCTSYSIYFNKVHKHVGHVFQDRFKAAIVDSDAYFQWLSVYIHANPKSAGLVKNLKDWKFSSYQEYLFDREGLCDKELILSEFKNSLDYANFVKDGISLLRDKTELGHVFLDDE